MTNSKSQKVGGSQAAGPAKCGAQQSKNKKVAAPVCVFENPEFGKVRTLTDDMGEPQFCGKDLCDVLGYKNSSDAIAKHVDGEDLAKREVSTPIYRLGKNTGKCKQMKMVFVNESGFYALLLSSKLPVAKKFKHWVTGDVLPKIRKDGFYAMKLDLELQKKLIGEQDIEIRRLNGVLDEQTRWASIQGENVINLEKQVDGLLPKAIYSDNVLDSVSCFTTTQVAKELGITAQELNRSLCALHIQYYQSGQYMLYAEYAHMGLAKSRTRYNAFLDPNCDGRKEKMGKAVTHTYLVWTEKGRKFIHDLAHRFWELAELYEVKNLG